MAAGEAHLGCDTVAWGAAECSSRRIGSHIRGHTARVTLTVSFFLKAKNTYSAASAGISKSTGYQYYASMEKIIW